MVPGSIRTIGHQFNLYSYAVTERFDRVSQSACFAVPPRSTFLIGIAEEKMATADERR
jgi:hypothetical protein